MEARGNIEQALADSLKVLAARTPFEKITIKQITDGAGVIRVTFYNHFQDKYDLLEWIVKNEIIKPVDILLTNGMYSEAVKLMFGNLKKEQGFYMRVADMQGQNSFPEIVERNINVLIMNVLPEQTAKPSAYPWLIPGHVAAYYAHSLTFLLLSWIRRGMEEPPEEMSGIYEYMVSHSLWDVIRDMESNEKFVCRTDLV
ncbi:MAG: TetR/AcrR family transcriptional regulator C-terminal domain-containing protein [Lachnospiraceae bacterium]|nr:TetR/AcrR family transcriptional regulator C-terminal domain-containing protein [Lachnospiraceae bacterium]